MASIRQVGTLATTASGAAITPAWPAATLAGSFLVALVISRNEDAQAVWTPADTDWQLAVAPADADDTPHVRIYTIADSPSRSGSESFGVDLARPLAGQVFEIEPGAGETLTLDEVASLVTGPGGTTDRNTGVTATTGGPTVQIGGVAVRNASRTLTSIDDGFTQQANGVAGSGFTGMRVATGSKIEAAAEAAQTGWTVNSASGSGGTGAIITVLIAAGGTGTPQHLDAIVNQPMQVTADLRVRKQLAAVVNQPVTVTADLEATKRLAAVVSQQQQLAGGLRAGTMRATISQPMTVTAALRLSKSLAAVITQPQTIAAALQARKQLAATISQSHTIQAAIRIRKQLAATISQPQIVQARLTVGVVVAIRRLRTLLRVGT